MSALKLNNNAVSRPGHPAKKNLTKPNTSKGFSFMKTYGDKSGTMKYVNFKPARLFKGHDKWFVFYYFRVPKELAHEYKSEWVRFRVYEGINEIKTDEYAKELVDAVNFSLENGFNPFEQLLKGDNKLSFNKSLDEFISYCEQKNLRQRTIGRYKTNIELLKEYFVRDNILYQPPEAITTEMMEGFFNHYNKQRNWAPRTYNSYLSDIGTIFQWLIRKKKITDNPLEFLEYKKTESTKNRYYDDATAAKLKAIIEPEDPLLFLFLETIYYTCTRPKSETRLLQVKHILFERDMLFIPASISKNRKDDYIPLAPELKVKLLPYQHLPPDTYLFGLSGPADRPVSVNVMASRYKVFKDRLGLDETYSTYGWKHTRGIHLANAGVDPYAIMKLMRHSGLEITMNYLRELGVEVDWNKYNIDKKF